MSGATGAARPRPPDPRVEQTRQLVFAATLELMAEHKAGPISVERISERSGIARSTIYRRWPDLSRLYFEAARQMRSQGMSDPTGDTASDLANYIADTAGHLNDPTYFSIIVFLLAKAGRSPRYAELHLELFRRGASHGSSVFLAGIDSGLIRPDVDVFAAADAVQAPLVYTRLARHERIDVAAAQRAVPTIIRRYGTRRAITALTNAPGRR